MTAEIAILNKEAIALAADSAVTMRLAGGQKIFTSASKLFTLSDSHTIGIMFYNSAFFMDIPWETIVKFYRTKLPKAQLNTLDDYISNFMSFLEKRSPLFPNDLQKRFLLNFVSGYFAIIVNEVIGRVQSVINQKGSIDNKATEGIVTSVIGEHLERWLKAEHKGSLSINVSKTIIVKYKKTIEEAINKVFQKLTVSPASSNQLMDIASNVLAKATDKESNSGVVIAGFGQKDFFPSIKSFVVDGVIDNKLKYIPEVNSTISHNQRGLITTFAQGEMVARFMEGIDPLYKVVEESYLNEWCNQYATKVAENIQGYDDAQRQQLKDQLLNVGKLLSEDFIRKRESLIKKQYINPITMLISVLPKNELAAMAESLVSLTSMKRRFTMEVETVAEPIDVAIITKGDGFIWIKRKHYFQAELNPQFFVTRYGGK